MRPGASERHVAAAGLGIVIGEDVEEGNLLDTLAGRVAGHGGDVENAETSAVVGLEGQAVVHVLIVVDGTNRGLVDTGLLWCAEVTDVPDISGREAVRGRSSAIFLIQLVIKQEVLLVVGVEDDALVRVGRASVASPGDDGRSGLVSDVVDGQRVLVVAIADVAASVTGVGSAVDQALCIVDIAVTRGTARGGRVGGVRQVDEDQSRPARVSAWLGADCNGKVLLLEGDDVVGATTGKAVEERDVAGGAEGLGRRDSQELPGVEDLDTVVRGLTADDEVVLHRPDLTPLGGDGLLGETTEVGDPARLGDLDESSAVRLADSAEFTSFGRCPTPRGGTRAAAAAQLRVGLEVLKVQVAAAECLQTVAWDNNGLAVDTLDRVGEGLEQRCVVVCSVGAALLPLVLFDVSFETTQRI